MNQTPPAPAPVPAPQLPLQTRIVYDVGVLATLDGINQFVQLALRLDRFFPNDEQRKIDAANATAAAIKLDKMIAEAQSQGMAPVIAALEAIRDA